MLAIPALAAYIALSSLFGLAGRFFFYDPIRAFEFMAEIWSRSIAADLVFVVGSILAAVFAFRMADRSAVVVASLAGWFASWFVYLASFMLLPREDYDLASQNILESLWFVMAWGFPGLIFASLAPPLVRRWLGRSASLGAP